MTEELKQKAKDFIDRIGKESGGNWLDKYYLTDLLVMFVTEATKELQDKLANADYQLEGRDLEIKELKERADKADLDSVLFFNQLCRAKEIIRELLNYDIILIDSTRKFEYMDLQKKAESFLEEVENA